MSVDKCSVMVRAELSSHQVISRITSYANEIDREIIVIDKPLVDKKYSSDKNILILLIPEHKITLINCGESTSSFDVFREDFIEDLGYLSDKYGYREYVGRPRDWKSAILASLNECELTGRDSIDSLYLPEEGIRRKANLFIGLLTGSINDIARVGVNCPQTLLEKIKRKIVLFDGQQTQFIYSNIDKPRIVIQGLSGTGKTELLLHKLKDLYISSEDSRILFTCHNKILAHSLRNRIPDFFNFMRVEQQIQWNTRLWCISAWGGFGDANSGAYRYITEFFSIPFSAYSKFTTFDDICKKAIDDIEKTSIYKDGERPFDFVLIDESQDFPSSFFDLCQKSCKKQTIVAGDIFQSIFDNTVISDISPDFLLSKCYRTDPKTLMFSHALGMGLFEQPHLQWLNEDEWKACGYTVAKEGMAFHLSRQPIRRFDDQLGGDIQSVVLQKCDNSNMFSLATSIIDIISDIRNNYEGVSPDDICVIFLDTNRQFYDLSTILGVKLSEHFGWQINPGYESKKSIKNTLLLSNNNNIKGLEFPFVICIAGTIRNNLGLRNSLYMAITRSFITSYVIVSQNIPAELWADISQGLAIINQHGYIGTVIPPENEVERIKRNILTSNVRKSPHQMVNEVLEELCIPLKMRPKLVKKIIMNIESDGDFTDLESIRSYAAFFYEEEKKHYE